jgi:hypothetical protein
VREVRKKTHLSPTHFPRRDGPEALREKIDQRAHPRLPGRVRQGPLWIVAPPLTTGERMSVNDPKLSNLLSKNGRSMKPRGL